MAKAKWILTIGKDVIGSLSGDLALKTVRAAVSAKIGDIGKGNVTALKPAGFALAAKDEAGAFAIMVKPAPAAPSKAPAAKVPAKALKQAPQAQKQALGAAKGSKATPAAPSPEKAPSKAPAKAGKAPKAAPAKGTPAKALSAAPSGPSKGEKAPSGPSATPAAKVTPAAPAKALEAPRARDSMSPERRAAFTKAINKLSKIPAPADGDIPAFLDRTRKDHPLNPYFAERA